MSNFFKNIADGKLGTVSVATNIEMDRKAIIDIGSVLFITGFLILLAWYTFKKLL